MTFNKNFWKVLERAGYTLNNYNRKEIDQALDIASKKIVEISEIRNWIREQRTAIEQDYKPKQKIHDWDKGYSDCLSQLNEYLESKKS